MLKNIKRSALVEVVRHARHFDYVDQPDCGFSFDCDERGTVDVSNLLDPGRANYEACVDGKLAVVDRGVVTYRHSYRNPGSGVCACGRTVWLSGDTDCDCGRIYNHVGQELVPRSQWDG